MKPAIMLLTHYGVGDSLAMNGVVQNLIQEHRVVYPLPFTNPRLLATVSWMYRDKPDVILLPVTCGLTFQRLVENAPKNEPSLRRAFTLSKPYDGRCGVEFMYGAQFGLHPDHFWDSFDVTRDRSIELTPSPDPYIFVHDDPARASEKYSFTIDAARLPKLPAFYARKGISDNLFGLLSIIEKAQEIHVIHSCIWVLCEMFPQLVRGKRLVLHWYARPSGPIWPHRLPWEILK